MTQPIQPMWADFTREERFFTAWLYHDLCAASEPFRRLLGLEAGVRDVGYEICFFRDFFHGRPGPRVGSFKQTFDLVLTLENAHLVIIEAKAQQSFSTKQLHELKAAQAQIAGLVEAPAVSLVGLHSGRYTPKSVTKQGFQQLVTWAQVAECYPHHRAIFERADSIYRQ